MKKLLALFLILCCVLSASALADFTDMAAELMNDVNFLLLMAGDNDGQVYVSIDELEELGVNFANEDGSLVILLIHDETGEALSTGIVVCTDEAQIRNAMNTVCSIALLAPGMTEDGVAVADWFDERYDSVAALYLDETIDRSEGSTEGVILDRFEGSCGLSVDLTALPMEDHVRFDLYFYLDPALNYTSVLENLG